MAFFVEKAESNGAKSDREPERLDLELLAVGKRAGLTFAEMNELRVKDLLSYVRAYTGKADDKPREATQADIDGFFA